MEENKDKGRNDIFTERVRAGKRTYFFDIKATRSNDYYLTITESKRRYKEDGFVYEKHKIFLYKEDFEKFANALNLSIEHVKTELLPGVDFNEYHRVNKEQSGADMPISESATTEEPTSEEFSEVPTNVEPISEESVSEEPVSEEQLSEEPVGEESVSEEQVSEESVSEEPKGEVSDEVEVEAEATDGSEESDLKWD